MSDSPIFSRETKILDGWKVSKKSGELCVPDVKFLNFSKVVRKKKKKVKEVEG